MVKNPPANAGDVRDTAWIPGSGRSPGVGVATHSSILAWKIPRTEEPGGLYSPWGREESDTTETAHDTARVSLNAWKHPINSLNCLNSLLWNSYFSHLKLSPCRKSILSSASEAGAALSVSSFLPLWELPVLTICLRVDQRMRRGSSSSHERERGMLLPCYSHERGS